MPVCQSVCGSLTNRICLSVKPFVAVYHTKKATDSHEPVAYAKF